MENNEFDPGPEDFQTAQELIDLGYMSTSTKYRMVAVLPDTFPTFERLVRPGTIHTRHGIALAELWKRHRRQALRSNDAVTVTLSVKAFRAFKMLGGETA